MSTLEHAKGHFKERLAGGLKKITVPEWKTDIYFKTAHSFAVESRIIQLQQEGKTVEALVETIIAKAMDPEGKPMFNKFDKFTFMNEVDPNVIVRVCGALNAAPESVEAISKNS